MKTALRRRPGWFRKERSPARLDEPSPPPTVIWDLSADSRGRLWVLAIVPDRRWRTAIRRTGGEKAVRPGWIVTDNARYYDIVLEVLDPNLRRVVAQTRLDGYLHAFAGSDHVVSLQADSAGTQHVVVWRVRIKE